MKIMLWLGLAMQLDVSHSTIATLYFDSYAFLYLAPDSLCDPLHQVSGGTFFYPP